MTASEAVIYAVPNDGHFWLGSGLWLRSDVAVRDLDLSRPAKLDSDYHIEKDASQIQIIRFQALPAARPYRRCYGYRDAVVILHGPSCQLPKPRLQGVQG